MEALMVSKKQTALARLPRKRRTRVSGLSWLTPLLPPKDSAFYIQELAGVNLLPTHAGKKKKVQTDPPSIPVAELLPGGIAPEGEWQSYKDE